MPSDKPIGTSQTFDWPYGVPVPPRSRRAVPGRRLIERSPHAHRTHELTAPTNVDAVSAHARLTRRMRGLLSAKNGVERSIDDEARRPLPDSLRLAALKSAKLRINDQLRALVRRTTEVAARRASLNSTRRVHGLASPSRAVTA